MKLTACLIAVSAVVFLSGCGDSPLSEPEVEENYFPMALGDWWDYDYSEYQTEPDSLLLHEGSEFNEVIAVSEDTFLVERTLSLWVFLGHVQPDTMVIVDTLTYLVNADSVFFYDTDSTGVKELDFPLELDKTWGDYTVTDMHAGISVPAGYFEDCACIEVPISLYQSTRYTYYAPGIGIVSKYVDDAYSGVMVRDIHYDLRGSSRIN